jgi:hypothetical protein
MAITYNLIASTTVGGAGTSSITFSSIPSTFTDLVLKTSSRSNNGSIKANLRLEFNGLATNFSATMIGVQNNSLFTQSEGATFANTHNYTVNANSSTASMFNNHETYISGYANSSYQKSSSTDTIMEIGSSDNQMGLFAHNWANTSAITDITCYLNPSSNFVQYTTIYLYGIKNT